jgi:hypothetical protein
MNERRDKLAAQFLKDDSTLDAVSYEAQEAILNPLLSPNRKDEIVGKAVDVILEIAERKATYRVQHGDVRRIIYQAK